VEELEVSFERSTGRTREEEMETKQTDYERVKAYWNERAREHGTAPESTTMDFHMRKIEIDSLDRVLRAKTEKDGLRLVGDLGCGNGYSTLELARRFPGVEFRGFDYSDEMIENARRMSGESGLKNTSFEVLDLTRDRVPGEFDLLYTDRCLINLPSWEHQQAAVRTIHAGLRPGGTYAMIENFIEGHDRFNQLRRQFGLAEIAVRDHNLFFAKEPFEALATSLFSSVTGENISSLYYIVSRIVYSKICQIEDKAPDYYDIHHELGSQLPAGGEFGPIYCYVLQKEEA